MPMHPSILRRHSDYVIGACRDHLLLPFELVDHMWNQAYENEACITDGRTWLMLWFTDGSQDVGPVGVPLEVDGGRVVVQAFATWDSRRTLDELQLEECIHRAHEAFLRRPVARDSVIGLCSMEIHCAIEGERDEWWRTIGDVAMRLGAQYELLPEYAGKAKEMEGYTEVPDATRVRVQLSLEKPRSVEDVRAMMSLWFSGAERIGVDPTTFLNANEQLRVESEIESMILLARMA